MQGSDYGHSQFAQERQYVTAGGSAEYAEFVLQAHNVNVADVQEVRGTQVRRQVLLLNLEANHFRIFVATRDVVDGHSEALGEGIRAGNRGKQVSCKGSDAALARQVVGDKRNLADFRILFHKVCPTRSART